MKAFEMTDRLPQKGVIFLGGHQNMTKKLRQYFPNWKYISDDQLVKHNALKNHTHVFYWTRHGSHKLMKFVYSKLPNNATIIFVTSTNIDLLIEEMSAECRKKKCLAS